MQYFLSPVPDLQKVVDELKVSLRRRYESVTEEGSISRLSAAFTEVYISLDDVLYPVPTIKCLNIFKEKVSD